jgi:Arc/MetJ-type ribon-helix-helix transcriptional regulator
MSIKATFVLDDFVIREAKEYVTKNHFKSLSAFVERAIRNELENLRQESIKASVIKAGSDPLFLADLLDVQQSFEHTDFEQSAI